MFKNGGVKLGDLNVGKIATEGLMTTKTGTPLYCPPEVWEDGLLEPRRRDEEDPFYRRTDGEDAAGGRPDVGFRGGQEARGERPDAVQLAQAFRGIGSVRCEASAPT